MGREMTARLPASFLGKGKSRYPVSPIHERTFDGIQFDSKHEMQRYAELVRRERMGIICDLSLQPEYRVSINGKHFCSYKADFKYRIPETGEWQVEDIKTSGTAKDAAFRLRHKAAQLFYGISINVVTDARA